MYFITHPLIYAEDGYFKPKSIDWTRRNIRLLNVPRYGTSRQGLPRCRYSNKQTLTFTQSQTAGYIGTSLCPRSTASYIPLSLFLVYLQPENDLSPERDCVSQSGYLTSLYFLIPFSSLQLSLVPLPRNHLS